MTKARVTPRLLAVIGVLVVVVSTVVGTVLLETFDDIVRDTVESISLQERQFSRLWQTHTQSDNDAATSELFEAFIAQGVMPGSAGDVFLRDRLDFYARNSAVRMTLATGQDDIPQFVRTRLDQASELLRRGDIVGARDKFRTLTNEQRLLSQKELNESRESVERLESQFARYQERSRIVRYLQLSFNLLGFAIVSLKDIVT